MIGLSLLKLIGGPGSIGFLAVGSMAGLMVARIWPRRRAAARGWLLTLWVGYLVLGLPVVAQVIAAPFAADNSVNREIAPVRALIVFDGDNRVGRVREALQVWSVAHPEVVVASGGEWLVDRLITAGIPSQRLVREQTSVNTREQVQYVKQYVAAHPGMKTGVIASRLQMPRVIALARRAHLGVAFFASPVDKEPAHQGPWLFVPTYAALRVSRDALYERVALAYYRRQGWIDAEADTSLARNW